MSLRVGADFIAKWHVFWATTYSFEMNMFEEFWLRRLGDPPLNATILVDFDRLSHRWEQFALDEEWRLKRANRDYLVRGIRAGNGAFHPKTYFFGNERDGVLLAGSGNLTLAGLDRGREVFSRYQRRNDEDLPVFAAWHQWMDTLVAHIDDEHLSRRWHDSQVKCPWLRTATRAASVFVSNWERSHMDQFADAVGRPVDELHVMAPFYDRDADALRQLIQRSEPRAVHLYLGHDVSVDGASLQAVLRSAGTEVHINDVVSARNRHEFIHAKLIGAVSGTRGWLLSGSPNLSRAALLHPVIGGYGNVETAIVAELPPERVRNAFLPLDHTLRGLAIEDLSTLTFQTDDASAASFALTLLSATRRSDGHIEVSAKGEYEDSILLSHRAGRFPLVGGVTTTPIDEEATPTIVWLTSSDDEILSNRTVVEHPERLNGWLRERTHTATRPPEFTEDDWSTPVGQMLKTLHENCIFDIDETPAARRARLMTEGEETADDSFWDRDIQEELKIDPRAERYASFAAGIHEMDDEIFLLMRQMMDRVRSRESLRIVGDGNAYERSGGEGTLWTPQQRLQTRLFNVLDRWCRVLSDPRLRWIDPLAPARNYLYLVKALYECWAESYLPRHRMIRLVGTLFGSYIRTDRAPGYLASLSAEDRAAATAIVTSAARDFATAMVYCSLRPDVHFREHIFEWQPFLKEGRELGIFGVGEDTEATVRRLIDAGQDAGAPRSTTSHETVVQRLTWAEGYINDQYWCWKIARELGLEEVTFSPAHVNEHYPVAIEVKGIDKPLQDQRLLTLLRQTLEYRHSQGILLLLPSGRISVRVDDYFYGLIGGIPVESNQRVTLPLLVSLEEKSSSLEALLDSSLRINA